MTFKPKHKPTFFGEKKYIIPKRLYKLAHRAFDIARRKRSDS